MSTGSISVSSPSTKQEDVSDHLSTTEVADAASTFQRLEDELAVPRKCEAVHDAVEQRDVLPASVGSVSISSRILPGHAKTRASGERTSSGSTVSVHKSDRERDREIESESLSDKESILSPQITLRTHRRARTSRGESSDSPGDQHRSRRVASLRESALSSRSDRTQGE